MKFSVFASVGAIAFGVLAAPSHAESVATVPEGYVTVRIAGSTDGSAHMVNFVAPPLLKYSRTDGLSSGRIASLTSNSVTVSGAGWTPSALATTEGIYLILKTGPQVGLTMRITGNTEETLTVDTEGLDLTTLGISVGSSGDTFQLVEGDTVLSVFGSPSDGVVGGTATDFASNRTDRIVLKDNAGVVRTIYWSTPANGWRRSGSGSDQGTIRISPNSGVLYYRISQEDLVLTAMGSVPATNSRQMVNQSGVTLLARYFPVATTLNDLGIHNLPGWRKTNQAGVTVATADKVVCKDNSGVIRSFYHNGTQWVRSGSGSPQNGTEIKVGSSIYTSRFGSGPAEVLVQTRPYSLEVE